MTRSVLEPGRRRPRSSLECLPLAIALGLLGWAIILGAAYGLWRLIGALT